MKGYCKNRSSLLILVLLWFNVGGPQKFLWAQQAPPVVQNTNSTPAAQPGAAPPPSSAPQRSTSDLEKLVAPIALYPDPVIAVLLPASAYPLEIVQAARFVRDTNNVAKLDSQPWDSNVKAVARIPEVIKQMDDNIAWTSDLGDAFINQPKELMDSIQSMRTRAESSGALKTTPQQVVNVTETIVTNVVESHTVYVTNQVVQIQPAQPNVVYVPQYNPTVVYAGYPVAYPAYTYPPYYPGAVAAASVLSFGAGMAMGAWLANDCDWGGGGCYHSDVNVNRDVNRNVNRNTERNRSANSAQNRGQKWQPDQNRLKNSGSAMSSAQSREARGWSSASRQTGAGSTRAGTASARAATTSGGGSTRAGTTAGGGRAGTTAGGGSTRAGGGTASQRGQAQARANTGQSRPNASARPAPTGRTGSSQSYNRPSSSSRGAFNSSGGAAQTRQSSSRGASSRSFGGGGGGGGRGGGGRGGGGRR